MAFEKIIVLDDELIVRKSLEQHLRRKHYTVAPAQTLAEAESYLARDQFDLVLADIRLPDGDGTQLLERCTQDPNGPTVVMMTGFGSIESAVDCMRRGAFDYIVKPCSLEEIDVVIKKAEAFTQQVKLNRYFSTQQVESSEILGRSSHIDHLRRMIQKVAATEATVLITGENGTGKELVAGELFRLSPLAKQPFIKVNCAAISENLIESEFFGHEKGAFTGALQRREGRFELAHNGTILLDEISEISPSLQAKLLRVLQEREFERVGGNRTIKVNVRVVATTNRDLLQEVREGRFREDLYYRLNVFPLHVPALRERAEDILLLAKAFLERFTRKHGVALPGFSAEAEAALQAHPWPGNVRELQNTIERAVILAEPGHPVHPALLGLVTMPGRPGAAEPASPPQGAPPAVSPPAATAPEPAPAAPSPGDSPALNGHFLTLEELEKHHILNALEKTDGRRKEAAELLSISSRTLRNKINQYRLEGEEIP